MPAFTRELERTLRRALSIAGEKGHRQASLAHLALAFIDDANAKDILRACDVDVTALKESLQRVADAAYLWDSVPRATVVSTSAFNLVIERAVIHVQACGRKHVASSNVLIALLAEPGDDAAEVLRRAGVTRFDATRFVSHGLRKARDQDSARAPTCYPGEAVRVSLLNDDFTPMEFVVEVVRNTFGKDEGEAGRLMLHIHKHGFADCGAYLPETAAAKVAAVAKLARDHQHPLHCVMEPITRGLSDALLFKKPRTVAASGPGDRQRA